MSTATLRLALLTIGIGVTSAGLGRLAVQGFAPDGSLDPTSVAAFALGVSIVGAAGVRRPQVVRGIPR